MAEPSKMENDMKSKAKKAMRAATDPVQKLKYSFLARGGAGMKNLSRWIRRVDDNGNQKLSFEEFEEGLRDQGMKDLSKDEMKEVFSRFDKDGNGQVNVTEFLLMMQPKMSDRRMKLVKAAFDKLNTDRGDKVITTGDLESVYDYSKHPKYVNGDWNGKRCLREFLDSFDDKNQPDGKVTFEEFCAYYSAISCGIDQDAYFDLMMRQAWGLEAV